VRALIRESVREVIVVGGLTAARYARDATTTVPVVVGTSSDLVDAGLVQSLAHPGGNITGISDLTDEVTVKRLQQPGTRPRSALPLPQSSALNAAQRLKEERPGAQATSRAAVVGLPTCAIALSAEIPTPNPVPR
jgi:putative ABC transport system substrate-binding protein